MWGTWVSKEFDGSEGELWRKLGSGSASAFAMFLQISDKNTDTNAICDSLTTISRSATWGNFDNWISDNGASIITGIQSITTVEAWREYLSEHPIQVCYKLATPVLLATLSPQEITTLLGTNTIWSDADSIDVEYRADTGLFLKQNTVKDVQVNGTSVTTDGVANVPLATNSTNGVLHPQTDRGVSVGSTGILSVNSSTSNEIKAGVHQYKPITPNRQHESTFYGLAKLAGVDMAQSSNAVGTYTDEAKIAIQKMLGIYEAPWEIIRDDTVTNASASDIEITVDGIGNAFELTDIIVYGILSATDVQAEFGSFGQSEYYYGSSDKDTVLNNTITVNVGTTKVFVSVIEQENGLLRKYGTTGAISGNTGSFLSLLTSNLRGNPVPFIIPDTKPRIYTKIVLKTITGKLQYRIFGKRKWN